MLRKYFLNDFFCYDNFLYIFKKNSLGTFSVDKLSTMLKSSVPESSKKITCEICDYNTSRQSQYDRHIATAKHKNQQLSTNFNTESSKLVCDCGKTYKERTGLWRHKKVCTIKSSDGITSELVLELIKNNKEMKQLLMEQSHTIQEQNTTINNIVHDVIKNGVTNNSNNTITNSHNKAFNLNVFLNETCKEALNMSDFVSSIKLSLEDLEHTGRKGYIEGISNIILRNLKELEEHNRPIHCSNQKREILYIKDNNKWEKDGDKNPILTNAIKVIANENIKQIKTWKDKNPDCTKAESKKNNLYLKIVSNSMNGLTEQESQKNINKIISNVAKETTIDKT